MTFYARLKHGSKHLDLSSGDYTLLPEFTPPSASSIPLMSGGSMLNRYSGGKRIDRSFADRGMNLPLRIQGDSAAETHGLVRKLSAFIEVAMNDSTNPLYFVFGESNAVPYEPTWGQQFKYYEVKDAEQAIGNLYGIASINQSAIFVNVPLLVAPFATGLRQRVGTATGTILEHTWATPDGISRGLCVLSNDRNYILNPVFGHSTFNTGWTDGAGVDTYENTDEEFVLLGTSSAKVCAPGGANRFIRASVDCDTTTIHTVGFHVKKPDNTAVAAADATIEYNGSGVTEYYEAVGDGWYLVWAQITGIAAATDLDLYVGAGGDNTIYVDGTFCIKSNYPMPPFYGDMLDCTWAGTAHNSESISTDTVYHIPDAIDIAEGSIVMAWTATSNESEHGDNMVLCVTEDSNYRIQYNVTTNVFAFTDGTNTCSIAKDVDFGDKFVLIATWGNDGIAFYANGTTDTDVYTIPAAVPDEFYLGSTHVPADYSNGTFLGLTIYKRQLNATEAAAHYADVWQHINGGDGLGQRLNAIPWLWTDDGDDTVDNCYESGAYENFFVCGGIPGNVPAETVIEATKSTNFSAADTLYLSLMDLDEYINPSDLFFFDVSGTANAAYCGGEYLLKSVDTSDTIISDAGSARTSAKFVSQFAGKNIYAFFRMRDAAADTLLVYLKFGFGVDVDSETKTITMATTNYLYHTNPVSVPPLSSMFADLHTPTTASFTIWAKHPVNTRNIIFDWFAVVPEPIIKLTNSSAGTKFTYRGRQAVLSDSDTSSSIFQVEGNAIEFHPDKINMLLTFMGADDIDPIITNTLVYKALRVTPRWSIL